jgi:hypothetical protein
VIADRWLDVIVSNLGDFLWPWTVINLPYFSEGVNETPGITGTSGEIATAGSMREGLAYGGELSDSGSTNPYTEKFWIHNWTCSTMFPGAPFSGRLYFRFTVDSECHIYSAPVNFGSVREFVTVGWTADVATQPLGNWNTVGWPVDVSLPREGSLNFGIPVPVSGSIAVAQGHNAALGFIYGTIVSVANGYVQFLGQLRHSHDSSSGTAYGSGNLDKIEYRFEPDWWIGTVARRMKTRAWSSIGFEWNQRDLVHFERGSVYPC